VTDGPSGDAGTAGYDVRFLGHATVVLDLPAGRLVTDPFLRPGLGPLRRHGPLPLPASIGPVDHVLLSHAHPDHFDADSLRALPGDPLVIAPRGLGGRIRRIGLRAREVSVGETVVLAPGWIVTTLPARHWRWPIVPGAATVGYLIEGPAIGGIYFAGDTSRFAGQGALRGRVELALLPIASWGPHLAPGHLSPRTAVEVARVTGARIAVPIHWGTLYPSRLDRFMPGPLRDPPVRFARFAAERCPGLDVRVLQPGDSTRV
jgi:L-ascorbate metabolism protein UlaG (beta-lactamase superfamily)